MSMPIKEGRLVAEKGIKRERLVEKRIDALTFALNLLLNTLRGKEKIEIEGKSYHTIPSISDDTLNKIEAIINNYKL